MTQISQLFRSPPPAVPALAVSLLVMALLAACSGPGQKSDPAATSKSRQQPLVSDTLALDTLELLDKNNRPLDQSVLGSFPGRPLSVSIDGHILTGRAPSYEQLMLQKKLATLLKSELNGTFIYLPWRTAGAQHDKNSALVRVGRYAAIKMPGDQNQIFICGGDENPDHVHFAADKTWIVKDTQGRAQVELGPQLNFARHNATLTPLADGKILISGGATPAVEIYDPINNKLSRDGIFAGAATTLAGLQLANGKILFICPAGSSEPIANSLIVQQAAPLTAILYDRLNKDVTEPIPLKQLSELLWLAPSGADGAVLLGNISATQFDQARLGKPTAERVTTAR